MEETGKRESEKSRVHKRRSWRSNEMEAKCESNCGRNKVYTTTFDDKENNGLKLDDDDEDMCIISFYY